MGTVTSYNITLYYNFNINPSSETLANWGLYYSVGTGNDNLITTLDTGNTCATAFTSGNMPSGSTVYFGVKATGKAATPVHYDVSISTCPNTTDLTYCGTYDTRFGQDPGPYSFNIGSSRTFYMTIAVNKTGFFITC
jgi:hypothetical protein